MSIFNNPNLKYLYYFITEYICHLIITYIYIFIQGPDYVHHIRFTAFIENFIHDFCGSMKPDVCFWQVQDDGVWLRHNPTGILKLMYEWGHEV